MISWVKLSKMHKLVSALMLNNQYKRDQLAAAEAEAARIAAEEEARRNNP